MRILTFLIVFACLLQYSLATTLGDFEYNVNGQTCNIKHKNLPYVYDLTPLSQIISKDTKKYQWSICGPLKIDDSCIDTPKDVGAVVITPDNSSTGKNSCRSLGTFESLDIKLYEYQHHVDGLTFTYQEKTTETKFTINYICGHSIKPVLTVDKDDSNDYIMSVQSVDACPNRSVCKADNKSTSLCSGQGHCAYDTTALKTRCFCYGGFSGEFCKTESSNNKKSSTPASNSGLITINIIIILLIIALVFYVIKKTRKLTDNDGEGAYARMDDGSTSYAINNTNNGIYESDDLNNL